MKTKARVAYTVERGPGLFIQLLKKYYEDGVTTQIVVGVGTEVGVMSPYGTLGPYDQDLSFVEAMQLVAAEIRLNERFK